MGKQPIAQGDNLAFVCPECNATAITKPEHALQTRGTPFTSNDHVSIQRLPVPQRDLPPSADDNPSPSILEEYHYSLLRICIYNLLAVAALLTCLAFLFVFS